MNTVGSRQETVNRNGRAGAGLVEQTLKDIIRDMTIGAKASLACRGILLSDPEETRLQRAVREFVNQSVEIERKVVEIMGRTPAA